MQSEVKKVEKIIGEHKSYLESISDGISEGISEGVKEGVVEGLKKGARDGLQECLTKGFVNIGQDDIQDILENIPQEIVKNSVKEGASRIFKISAERYVRRVCQKLVDRVKKGDIKLSKGRIGLVLRLFKRGEREAVKKIVERLPDNPLFRAIIAGVQSALEENLEKSVEACGERIQKEIARKSLKR